MRSQWVILVSYGLFSAVFQPYQPISAQISQNSAILHLHLVETSFSNRGKIVKRAVTVPVLTREQTVRSTIADPIGKVDHRFMIKLKTSNGAQFNFFLIKEQIRPSFFIGADTLIQLEHKLATSRTTGHGS